MPKPGSGMPIGGVHALAAVPVRKRIPIVSAANQATFIIFKVFTLSSDGLHARGGCGVCDRYASVAANVAPEDEIGLMNQVAEMSQSLS
jgi:hypothetical protein